MPGNRIKQKKFILNVLKTQLVSLTYRLWKCRIFEFISIAVSNCTVLKVKWTHTT